jgi:hypothetical protein
VALLEGSELRFEVVGFALRVYTRIPILRHPELGEILLVEPRRRQTSDARHSPPNSPLDYNDAKRGLAPPAERSARERRDNHRSR